MSNYVNVHRIENQIAVLVLQPNNDQQVVLDAAMLDELDRVMQGLAEQSDIAGLIVKSAGRDCFALPMNFELIGENLDWSDQKIVSYCQRGRAVLARFSRCPFPTVAAIKNECVGNALELALWCDYRLAIDDEAVRFAMPAVKYGLVSPWAGSVLLPRVVGLDQATEILTSGQAVNLDLARGIGLVDEVVPVGEVDQRATALLRRVQTSRAFTQYRTAISGAVPGITPPTWQDIAQPILDRTGQEIVANQAVFPYAPTVLLEHLIRTCVAPAKEAWRSESAAVVQTWGSPASRGLLRYESARQRNQVSPGLVDMSLNSIAIETVGVVGAGLMGSSIAKAVASHGLDVCLLDANRDSAVQAAERIQVELEKDNDLSCNIGNVRAVDTYDSLAECDLVIESVVETIDVKKIVLQKIESIVGADAIIASNTSAIPIEKLGSFLSRPERFCGIHFCHPELMSLVEVVCGPATAEVTVTAAVRFVQTLNKIPVAMNDSPGFVVNRLLAALLNASLELYTQGVDVPVIDATLRVFGFQGGPFEIIDTIGVDTCMYAGRTMWESGLDCVALSPVLPKLVKNKRLGRKSGAGFYDYTTEGSASSSDTGIWSDETQQLLSGYRDVQHSDISDNAIVDAIVGRVAEEAKKILNEEIVADPLDIDLCLVSGFSFPRHQLPVHNKNH